MFYLSYLRAELLRRFGKTLTIALGLSIASAIIIAIISVSSSLQTSQQTVLDPLSSVGTDMLVTRTVSQDNLQQIDQTTRDDLMADNNVFTDLSKLGKAGDAFKSDTFAAGSNLTFPVSSTLGLDTSLVANYSTGLIMTVTHQEGTIPTITASFSYGGDQIQVRQDVPQLSDADMQAMQAAQTKAMADLKAQGIDPNSQEGRQAMRQAQRGAIPQRQVTSTVTTEKKTVTQNVDTPQTNIKTSNYTIAGVDLSQNNIGLILPSQVIQGSYFSAIPAVATTKTDTTATPTTPSSPLEAIVSQSYAQKQNIKVGDKLTLSQKDLTVIGIVEPKLYTNTADVYVSLPLLQQLSGKTDRVNILLIKSTNAANVSGSETALAALFTGATVTSAADTAKQVSGSLTSVTSLMNKFVGVISLIVLIAAFIIVTLITLLSVNKRVREIGTLKAFGWSNYKIIRQILMENFVLGLIGAALGIGFALIGIYVLNHANITLNADVSSLNSSLGGMIGRFMGGPGRGGNNAAQTATSNNVSTTVALHVTLATSTLLVGTLVSIVGSLFAGLVASFKASRMRPQVALRNLE